ncbi:Cupredoxin-like domain protein [uncultured archaeon]|nr:Cupredoxin-like domain protein [uncultured archaeon]
MRKILFIGLVVTVVVLVSGCYGPTTSPNATVQPTGGTPGEITPVMTPVETITPVMTPVETITPVMTATSIGISTVTKTPSVTATGMVTPTVTGTSHATTPVSTYSYATTPAVTTTVSTTPVSATTGTATASMTVAAVNAVDIKSTTFDPAIITVPIGTTVTWTNRDTVPHIVRGSGFDSGSLDPGQTFSRTFSTTGSYDYGDPSHPSMSGTVVVT